MKGHAYIKTFCVCCQISTGIIMFTLHVAVKRELISFIFYMKKQLDIYSNIYMHHYFFAHNERSALKCIYFYLTIIHMLNQCCTHILFIKFRTLPRSFTLTQISSNESGEKQNAKWFSISKAEHFKSVYTLDI